MDREIRFEREVIDRLSRQYPGAVILKNDSSFHQGIPDRLILFERNWAALEFKSSETAARRPNQVHYINRLDDMSYASFIYPENMEEVLDELQYTLKSKRPTRLLKR